MSRPLRILYAQSSNTLQKGRPLRISNTRKGKRLRKKGGTRKKRKSVSSPVLSHAKSPVLAHAQSSDLTAHMNTDEEDMFHLFQHTHNIFHNPELIQLMIHADMNDRTTNVLLSIKAFYNNRMSDIEANIFFKTLCDVALFDPDNSDFFQKTCYKIIKLYVKGSSYTLNYYLYKKPDLIDDNKNDDLSAIYYVLMEIIQEYCMMISSSAFSQPEHNDAIAHILMEKRYELQAIFNSEYLLATFARAMVQIFEKESEFITRNEEPLVLYRGINQPYSSQLMGLSSSFISTSSNITVAALHAIGSYVIGHKLTEPGFIMRLLVEPGMAYIDMKKVIQYANKVEPPDQLPLVVKTVLHSDQDEHIFPPNIVFEFVNEEESFTIPQLMSTNRSINQRLKRDHKQVDQIAVIDVIVHL